MKTAIALAAALTCATAHADFIDQDVTTLDTSTGLEWLDLSESRGLTWEEASASFPGWRHATSAEVQAVFAQFGIPLVAYTNYTDAALVERMEAWERLFNSAPRLAYETFIGMVADVYPDSGNVHGVLWGYGSEDWASLSTIMPTSNVAYAPGLYAIYGDCCTVGIGEGLASTVNFGRFYDHFLVREAEKWETFSAIAQPVPEPEIWELMLLGLVGVGIRRNRK